MPKKLIRILDHFCPHKIDRIDLHLSGSIQDISGLPAQTKLVNILTSDLTYRAIWLESNLTWYLLDVSTWTTVLKLYNPKPSGVELVDLCTRQLNLTKGEGYTVKGTSAIHNHIYKGK